MNNITLCIGDLHIGNNKNNSLFHKISLDYAEWVKSVCIERNITHIIQMGDVFHDRTSVNLTSLQCAYDFFNILKDFRIDIICGNHDAFYSDNSSVNSLGLLKNWSNMNIHDKPNQDDWFVYIPWGIQLQDMPCGRIGIGHLEVAGYQMNKNKLCENGIKGVELMENFDLLLTGHFHKPQERQYSKKRFIYTGSAFQLNWGESGEKKFVYLVNPETLEIEKIENTISPRFEYINSEQDYHKIPNNFIAINIPNKNDADTLIAQLQALNPLDIKTQYTELDITETNNNIEEFKIVNIPEVVDEFTTNMINLTEEQQKEVAKDIKALYDSLS